MNKVSELDKKGFPSIDLCNAGGKVSTSYFIISLFCERVVGWMNFYLSSESPFPIISKLRTDGAKILRKKERKFPNSKPNFLSIEAGKFLCNLLNTRR